MDDLFTKVCKLIEFCALITFGAFSSDHLDRTSTGFIGSYIVLKGVLAVEYGNGKLDCLLALLEHYVHSYNLIMLQSFFLLLLL
jgi:hypothetical protein